MSYRIAQTEDSAQTDKTNDLCPLRTKEMIYEISRGVALEYYGSQLYGDHVVSCVIN